MKMLIRSMAPRVIVADEIGTYEDVEAIKYAVCSGTKGIFTVHGDGLEELFLNPVIKELLEENVIERIIFLDGKYKKGGVKKVYFFDKKNREYKELVD